MARQCRVLVIEHDREVQAFLSEVFAEHGYAVDVAANSADAGEAIRLGGYDLMVIDVSLPGGEDGFPVAAHASADPVGVILITAHHSIEDRLAASGYAYLLKPFRLDDLYALAVEVMRKM